MDWNDAPEQAAFRAQVRAFVQEQLPAFYRRRAEEGRDEGWDGGWARDRKSADAEAAGAAQAWADALASRGWVAPHWPKEYGGGGMSPLEQFVLQQELFSAGAPTGVGGSGVGMLGPTLIAHGTAEQRAKYLPRILSGETAWAQGYSEPGAGSDLGSLQTRALRDGDEYVVNGQKIWTSGAHQADALFALVRTDPAAPKHRGISFLLIDDIHTPGLTIRPLINIAWAHGFNETFFEDVRVPVNVVGEENRGWYVAMTLLDFERSNIGGAVALQRELERLIADATSAEGHGRTRLDGGCRAELADRYIETQVGFNFSFRIVSMQARGLIPNYEASTAKLFMSELMQRNARTGMRVLGLYANIWDEDDARTPLHAYFTHRYINTVPYTIGGGTSEVQRNIIATRGLGLPRG
jgi:alkylation response protein AidB-like acyl-CoA dehydrogenase